MTLVALISDSIVVQIAAWDGVTPWDHPLGMDGIELEPGEWCEPGALYDPDGTPRFSTLL